MGGADSIWFRAENHFAGAEYHPYLEGTDWFVSPDRMLEIHWQGAEDAVLSGKWRFYQSNAAEYDSAFFAQINAWGMDEDSVHLLYRPFNGENWSLYPDATINTMGSAANGNGRFDFSRILPGQYTLAAHTGVLSVKEQMERPWCIWNQRQLQIQHAMDELLVYDMQGKQCRVFKNIQANDALTLHLDAGMYLICAQKGSENWSAKMNITH